MGQVREEADYLVVLLGGQGADVFEAYRPAESLAGGYGLERIRLGGGDDVVRVGEYLFLCVADSADLAPRHGMRPDAENIPLMIEAIPLNSDCIVLIITKVEDPEELDTRFSRFTPTPADEAADKHKSVLEHLKKLDGAEDFLDILRQMKEAVSQLPENPEALADTPVQEQAPASEAKEAAPAEPSVPPVRLFSFSRLDSVIHASHFLAEMYDGPNTLYKDEAENMYILTLAQGEHPSSDFNRICNMLSEYGSPEQGGGISLAFLEEHCDMILAKNAIQTLTSFK